MSAGSGSARPRVMLGLGVLACLGISAMVGFLIPIAPALAIALVVAGILSVAALTQPLLAVSLLLAMGGMPMEGLTGGQKSLFQGFGGASASGVVLVAMVGVLSLVVLSRKSSRRVSFLDVSLAMMIAVAAVSILWTPIPAEGIRVLTKTVYPVLILLAARSLLVGERERDIAFRFIFAGGLIVSVIALIALFTTGLKEYAAGGIYRYTSGLTHPTPFGFYMVALFALCYPRWKGQRSWQLAALSVLFGLQAVLSMSRMAMLGVFVVIVITEFVFAPPRTRWLRAGAIGAAIVLTALATVLAVPRLQEGVFYSTQSLSSSPAQLEQSFNDQGRSNIREAMLADLSASGNWMFGNGMGASTVELQRGAFGELGGVGVAHDEYMRLLYDTGIVGLSFALLVMIVLVVTAFRAARGLPEHLRWLGAAAMSLAVCYGVFAATDNVLDYYNQFSQFVFFTVGVALAASTLRGNHETATLLADAHDETGHLPQVRRA